MRARTCVVLNRVLYSFCCVFFDPVERPAMITSGIIGGMAGVMWAIQSSSGRLMGFFENTEEVKRMR